MSKRAMRLSAISVEIQTPAQAWKLIERDYTLRLSLVAGESATEHLKAWNAVFAEGRKRGNAAYFGPALVEMEIADSDKRAEWSFRTCCEIWEVQGRTKCRPFFRAVFESCLQPMFSIREGCFMDRLERHQKRTAARIPQGLAGLGGHLNREMMKLRARWNTKLEIATRDNEYQQQRMSSQKTQQRGELTASFVGSPPDGVRQPPLDDVIKGMPYSNSALMPMKQVYAVALSFKWTELEGRFRDIQAKPSVHERVSAEFTRTEWDSGAISEEWTMRGNAVCRTEFEYLASIAARKLGYAGSGDAFKYWLERVREWLHRTGLGRDNDLTWSPTGQGHVEGILYKTSHLTSERISELSAMFCMELMAHGAPESTVSPPPPLERPETPNRQSRTSGVGPRKNKTKNQLNRMGVIFGAIQSGLKALKYCAALDERKVRPPDRWIEEDCPSTYAQAYRDTRWRKRIQDEKCRYREQYELTSAQEREAMIQGNNGTRHTRR